MHNAWVDTLGVRRRHAHEQLSDTLPEQSATRWDLSTNAQALSAEDEALRRLRDDRISALFREIPTAQRDAVFLADIAPYRQQEIAAILGTPTGTVMSRVFRGRKRLHALARSRAPHGS